MMKRNPYGLSLPSGNSASLLSGIVGVMVFLALLSLGSAMALSSFSGRWEEGLGHTITVELLPIPSDLSMEERAEHTLGLLKMLEGIESVRLVSLQEIESLLKPWLGESIGDLPLPTLIEVTLDSDYNMNLEALEVYLKEKIDGVQLDDHQIWLADITKTASLFHTIGIALFVLITLIAGVAIGATTTARLMIHAPQLKLLHVVGATDAGIAKEVRKEMFALSAKGALGGSVCFLVVILALKFALQTLQTDNFLPGFTLSLLQWYGLLVVPVFAILASVKTADHQVLKYLKTLF